MFGSINNSGNSVEAVEVEAEEVELEAVLSEDAHLKHMRMAALEMAMSLVINRESGEDAVAITQMADVFYAWLENGEQV